jgi:hypothetical protein
LNLFQIKTISTSLFVVKVYFQNNQQFCLSLLFWLNLSLWEFFRKIQWMCCERERSPFSHIIFVCPTNALKRAKKMEKYVRRKSSTPLLLWKDPFCATTSILEIFRQNWTFRLTGEWHKQNCAPFVIGWLVYNSKSKIDIILFLKYWTLKCKKKRAL